MREQYRARPSNWTDRERPSRRFLFLFNVCKNWTNTESLLRRTIPSTESDALRTAIDFGDYDRTAPNNMVIREHLWEQTVQPGWTIFMSLWPLPEGISEPPRNEDWHSQLQPIFHVPIQLQRHQSPAQPQPPENGTYEPLPSENSKPQAPDPPTAAVATSHFSRSCSAQKITFPPPTKNQTTSFPFSGLVARFQ
ncbi:hypothetical protein K432DRAFT_402119 [Lepidopterella palustris CBS 459.81]|uniref:Ubiquitin-like domain-containing protein n=1 Tax=Lepidopterella palustris CBS 459.81 TaxID=1314670 RepID=A0A8E2EGG5_9PEZI|nr:hypothetical protein K432DRAFT_402119 [Lepidopterella palustris CBS 459.81]